MNLKNTVYFKNRYGRFIFAIAMGFFSFVIILLLAGRFALANEEGIYVVSKEALDDGGLFFITDTKGRYVPAPLLKTEVTMDVSGPVVRVRVNQSFTNMTNQWVEGIYTFPLPEKSAVDRLTMVIGERRVIGEIQEKEQARKTYEKAKAEGRRTSLVSQERPNIFTNQVANIGPGETIVIEIEYQDQARFLDGEFELRFPMVVRPRYIPGDPLPVTPSGSGWSYDSNQVPDASRITPVISSPSKGPINPVAISVSLDPGFLVQDIVSPSHDIKVRKRTSSYQITLKGGEVPADSDFVLQWMPVPGTTPVAGMFSEKIEGEYYHLFMVLPRTNASDLENIILPREVVFIVDVSGSMGGDAITQAKAALLKGLDGLRPGDRFNIITFNNSAYDLFKGAVPANQHYLEEARDFVLRLYANGGTEMASALQIALNGNVGLVHLRQIIFITDGAVGNEQALFQMIHQGLGDSRLFTVGIGSSPNSHFMREAAEMGKGTFTYIAQPGEVDEKMNQLLHKLETPLLKDISITLPDGVAGEIFPENIPDLYDGEPLLITLKTDKKLNHDIVFKGAIAGAEWRETLDPDGKSKNKGIGALWAREKIRDITNQSIKNGTIGAPEVRDAIIKVALAHQLVSKYTSLVAVDDEIARQGDGLKSTPIPTNLPKGMDPNMVAGKQIPAANTTPAAPPPAATIPAPNPQAQARSKASNNASGFAVTPPAAMSMPPVGADASSEQVVVTGTRIPRQDLVANSPIAVVGAEEINLNGQIDTGELLNDLPQTATGMWQKLLFGFVFLMGALVLLLWVRKREAGCKL